jgi:cytochrome c oxidase assembly protein subunit 15
VAGLDAGLAYNTWPLMDGAVVPSGLLIQEPWWRNLFENAATVQFDHRVGAYVLFAVAVIYALAARRTGQARGALLLMLVVSAQAAIGIATLVSVVPLHLALLHQFGAIAVLSYAVTHFRSMLPPLPVQLARAAAAE